MPGERVASVGAGQPGRGLAPVEQDLRDVPEPVPLGGEAQPQVVVLGEVSVPPARCRVEHLAPDGRGGVDERRLHEQVAGHQVRRHEAVQPGDVAGHPPRDVPARKEPDPGADRGERGVGVERRELPLDAAGVGHVVGVHAHHHLGVARCEAAIQRPGDALPGPVDHPDPPVAAGDPVQEGAGAVAGAVVDRHQREVAETLPEDGDGRRANGSRRVAGRQEDGHAGHGGRPIPGSRRR